MQIGHTLWFITLITILIGSGFKINSKMTKSTRPFTN